MTCLDNSSRPSKVSYKNVEIRGSLWCTNGGLGVEVDGGADASTLGGGGTITGGTSKCTRGGGVVDVEDHALVGTVFLFFECVPS